MRTEEREGAAYPEAAEAYRNASIGYGMAYNCWMPRWSPSSHQTSAFYYFAEMQREAVAAGRRATHCPWF